MIYKELVAVYEQLEGTSKRLEKTWCIAQLLKKTPLEDLEHLCLLLQGRLFPAYDEREVGVASRLVIKALSLATGHSTDKVEQLWKRTGDLGKTAELLIAKKHQATLAQQHLTVRKVFENLRKLAELEGEGVVDRKLKLIAELLTSASPLESKYIIKTVLQDLRIGVGEGVMRDAILWAFFTRELHILYDNKENLEVVTEFDRKKYMEYAASVQRMYDLSANFGEVAAALKKKGKDAFGTIELEVGKPLKVMLYQKAIDIKDAFETVGKPAALEYKYDGFRMQIHKNEDTIELFTRRLERVTNQFPDVVKVIKAQIQAKACILDAEIIGIDPKTRQWMPFQNISQRIKRKYDIEETIRKIPVMVNVFDILYADGKTLLHEPFSKRRALIERIVREKKDEIQAARQIITSSEKEALAFYEESLNRGNEGIMAKSLDKEYKPGSRVGYGVKVKPVMETLDLVIVGAEWGEGKRSGWLSSFVLACRDGIHFREIGRVGTGIKELESEGVTFEKLTKLLKPLIFEEKGKEVTVKPKIVLEIDYEEIQKSPTYGSGYALRFPRVLRLREDKSIRDASEISYIKQLYEEQK